MCSGDSFPAWEAQVIRYLLGQNDVSIELLIFDNKPSTNVFSLLQKVSAKHLIWQVYYRLFVHRAVCDRKVDMSGKLRDVARITCKPLLKGKYSQYFSRADVKRIQSYHLDVILRFGFNIIRGEILNSAVYGVWSYHHDDNTRYRGMPACFWEIYHADPLSGALLQQLTEQLD